MPKLTTEVKPPKLASPLRLGAPIFAIGSCFTDNIGERFTTHFYPWFGGPFGTVYHPEALAEQVTRIMRDIAPPSDEIEQVGDVYVHDLFHGDFSATERKAALAAMQSAHAEAVQAYRKAEAVVLTLGTAFGYLRRATGRIVANCHKRPAKDFERRLIYGEAIAKNLAVAISDLQAEGKKVILTISPVRHVRDSLTANQLSKAQLITACHLLREEFPDLAYFPAYEILLDELRDYRFYASDLAHPSQLAIDIIFERFATWLFDGEADCYFSDADALRRRMSHRVLRPGADAAGQFLAATQEQQRAFFEQYPFARVPDTAT